MNSASSNVVVPSINKGVSWACALSSSSDFVPRYASFFLLSFVSGRNEEGIDVVAIHEGLGSVGRISRWWYSWNLRVSQRGCQKSPSCSHVLKPSSLLPR